MTDKNIIPMDTEPLLELHRQLLSESIKYKKNDQRRQIMSTIAERLRVAIDTAMYPDGMPQSLSDEISRINGNE